jgi:transcriptional regulator with XRE-family HTH domain
MSGKKLREKIKLCGISLREVADLLGISEQNLQNKLNADDIKVSFLVELSKKLNKDINYFLDMPQSIQKNDSGQQIIASGNLNKITAHNDNRQYYSDSPDVLRAQIEKMDDIIREKDERLREKDERLREKDAYIAELKETLRELKNANNRIINKDYIL